MKILANRTDIDLHTTELALHDGEINSLITKTSTYTKATDNSTVTISS